MLQRWLARLLALRHEERIHQEIADEREFHIAMRAADLIRSGMSEAEAERTARRAFGAAIRSQEAGFDVRGGGVLADIVNDIRIGVRVLRKTLVKTAALLITVALSIGINTAVFSVMKAVVLNPLPFADARNLVIIHQVGKAGGEGVSYPNFEDWRASSRSFDGLAVFAPISATLTAADQAHRVFGAVVSADLFHVLGVLPVRGRLFNVDEDAPHAAPTVLISDTLWRSQFQAREDIIGQQLVLDGAGYRIIGVIPSTLAFPVQSDPVNYWITVAIDAQPSAWGGSVRKSRGYPRYQAAVARLKPGVTTTQAQAEMMVIAATIARQHPGVTLSDGVRVTPAIDDVVGKVRPLLWTLYGAVFCVLAAGCANVATLLLVGAVARNREFALRTALGARSSRLVRQLMVESLVVAIAGGALGALLAWRLVEWFTYIVPAEIPRSTTVHPDAAMLIYALLLSLVTGIAFGLAPALTAMRHDLAGALKMGGRTQAGGAVRLGAFRPGTILIAGQIALSMLLGCAAAVLTGSFWHILHAPRGFDPHDVLTASISLPPTAYPAGSPKVAQFYGELIAKLRGTPGVITASAAQSLPLSGQNNSTRLEVVGSADRQPASADLRFVDPGYFEALRIPLVEGRTFDARDERNRPPVVVLNQAFVARFLDGKKAIGERLRLGWGGDDPKLVVGVIGDIRHNALGTEAAPEMYVPLAQFPLADLSMVIRTNGDTGKMATTLRERVRQMDAGVPVEDIRTLDEYLLLSAAPQRFLMWVLLAFACSTVLLAAIGLYGALSYSMTTRQHEFGVRMALGADAWDVVRLVLREGLGVATAGLAAGLALTIAGAQVLNAWLYETSPLDARSLACAGAALMIVATLACWAPARRATRINPIISLRGE